MPLINCFKTRQEMTDMESYLHFYNDLKQYCTFFKINVSVNFTRLSCYFEHWPE